MSHKEILRHGLHEQQLAKIYQKNLPPIWEPPLQKLNDIK